MIGIEKARDMRDCCEGTTCHRENCHYFDFCNSSTFNKFLAEKSINQLPELWLDSDIEMAFKSEGENMKKNIKMTVDMAKKLYEGNNEFRDTILSVFTDGELGIDNRPKKYLQIPMVDRKDVKLKTLERENARGKLLALAYVLNDCETESEWMNFYSPQTHTCVNYNSGDKSLWIYTSMGGYNSGEIFFKRREDAEFSKRYHKDLWLEYFGVKE